MIKIAINSDKDFVKEIREKIKANNGHCACAIVKDEDTVCMCREFREQISRGESGECHCGLYQIVIQKD